VLGRAGEKRASGCRVSSDVGRGNDGRLVQQVTELILWMGNRMMRHFGEIGGMTRVSGKHIGRHVGGEVVDDHLEFCRVESRLSSDGRKDIEHATGVDDQLRNHTGDRLDLLSTEGLCGFKSIPCLRTRARWTRPSRLQFCGKKDETNINIAGGRP
jgi:hypothetical protein